MDFLKMLVKLVNPNIDADLLLAQTGVVLILLPTVEAAASKGVEGSAAGPIEEVPGDTREEAKKPLLTPEEVVANLSTSDAEVTEKSTEKGDENPTEGVSKVTDGTTTEKEVQNFAKKEGRKKLTPRDEAAKARAATVHIYQRRPARAEASRKKTTEEPQNKAPEKTTKGGDERQQRSAVEQPRCRRRLILADEPNKIEEEVILALIEALPSSGQLTPPTEVVDPEKERMERKRKGKAVAGPLRKIP